MTDKNLTQKVRGLFSGGEDRGVSPVIGVILMVAITVVLAAVIAAAVMGIGGDIGGSSAPSAQLSISESTNAGDITVSHNGGDAVDFSEFSVIVNGTASDTSLSGELSSGESRDLTIGENGDGLEIQLRHDPSQSVLASGTVDASGTTDTTDTTS